MGKADLDLPDVIEAPSPAGAGTDDLLSQLAGDEIDRMLAEADVETPAHLEVDADAIALDEGLRAPARPAGKPDDALRLLDAVQAKADLIEQAVSDATAPPAAGDGTVARSNATATANGATAAADLAAEAELDALFDQLNQPTEAERAAAASPPTAGVPAGAGPRKPVVGPTPASSTATSSTAAATSNATGDVPAEQSLATELDDLFKQLTEPTSPAPSAAPQPPAAAPKPDPSAPPGEAVPEADATRAADERAGLGLADLAATVAAAPKPSPGDYDDAPLPLLLRPLEWLNAPFANLPDGLRDVMGKAAIVTLVNASAVILYVVLFRKS